MTLPRHARAVLMVLSVLLVPCPSLAQSGHYRNLTKVANARSAFANVFDFVVDGGYVYAADRDLVIWDVSDPASPQEVKVVDVPGTPAATIAVGFGRAYVGDGSTISIVDISDPPNAFLAGSISIPFSGWVLPLDGNTLYTIVTDPYAPGNDGLYIVDVSNPASPQVVSALPAFGPSIGAAREGNLAALSSGELLDVSSPVSPVVVGNLNQSTQGVEIRSPYLYAAMGSGGIRIWDISNPAAPALLGQGGTYGLRVAVGDDHAYSLDAQGFRVFDVSNLSNPRQVGKMGLGGDEQVVLPQAIRVSNGYLYAAFRHGGISIFEIAPTPEYTDPTNSGLVIEGRYRDMAVVGDRAYASINGLHVLDLSDPTTPALVTSIPYTGQSTGAVAAAGSYLCLGTDSGIDVFDLSDPDLPASRPGYATGNAVGVAVIGDHAYVTQADQGPILVLDLVPPHNPNQGPPLAGSVPYLSNAEFIGAWGERLIVSDGGLRVLDASAPNQANPVQIGTLNVPPFEDAQVVGSLAYLAGDVFSIVDLSDPANPVELSRTDPFIAGNHVAVVGSYAYFVNALAVQPWEAASATLVIDVVNPAAPAPIGMLSQELEATGPVGVKGLGPGYVLACYEDAFASPGPTTTIQSLPTQSTGVTAIVSNNGGIQRFLAPPFPNPIRRTSRVRYTVKTRGRVTLDLLDVSGRVARRLLDRIEAPGTGEVRWNLADQPVPAGVYFLQFRSRDVSEARKVMVLP